MFIFKKVKNPDNRYDTANLEMRSEAVSLPEVLADFQDFLSGCGYQLEGELTLLEDSFREELPPEDEDLN
jgi:hypothetical protein